MPKKDGSSSTKTIEQVRESTQTDVKRILEKRHIAASAREGVTNNRSALGS
jgi:hypothetical protein